MTQTCDNGEEKRREEIELISAMKYIFLSSRLYENLSRPVPKPFYRIWIVWPRRE